MLPIAVLPVAALMLRLGQPDLFDIPFVAASGAAIFANLGLLFAVGVGFGLAKENNGAAGLAGAVAFLVLTEGAKALISVPAGAVGAGVSEEAIRLALVNSWKQRELAKLSVPAGILSGLAAGYLYNRFHAIKLPTYLSFFGGRRFVPIAAGVFGLVGAAAFGFGFPVLEQGVDNLSKWVAAAGSFGLFLYGLLNRLLIITGLHHILNNLAWFVLGDFRGATGDLNRFFAGDPSAGAFMAGFFPVMMFGLPAACLAMWRSLPVDRRKPMAGMYFSMAMTSLLTGVTEPIEFSFMFLAPLLFLLHAVLSGLSMVVMDVLQVRLGFGFSAGLFDYVLNYRLATNPLYLVPVGLAYFGVYYAAFRFAIVRFAIKVPGLDPLIGAVDDNSAPIGADSASSTEIEAYVSALGGISNLESVDACTTRLRLVVTEPSLVDEPRLKSIGAKGILKLGANAVQVIIGPDADRIAGEIRNHCAVAISERSLGRGSANQSAQPNSSPEDLASRRTVQPVVVDPAVLGGPDNIALQMESGRRQIFRVIDRGAVDFSLLEKSHAGGWFESAPGRFHIAD
jgi:PTS system N-acetylglucosamine-specific IIC component